MSGLILVACLAVNAGAQEPTPPPAPAPVVVNPVEAYRVELDDAKALWFRGEGDLAHSKLQGLYYRAVAGAGVPLNLAGECAVYLGEIELDRGSIAGAEAVWRWLLTQDPNFPISPYQHPIEVIGQFEMVRKQVRSSLPTEKPPQRVRYPAWGYAPFGVPQLRQGKRIRGGVYLGAQAALGALSVGLWVDTALANPKRGVPWPTDHPYGWTDTDATQRLLEKKYLLQWPATIGFYGLWLVSAIDGQTSFRADEAAPNAGASPLPLGIAGRW